MFTFDHITQAEPYLAETLSGTRFLRSADDFSNSSCFVAPYDPAQQPECEQMVNALVRDLATRGHTACVVNAYDLFLQIMDEDDIWEPYAEAQRDMPVAEFINALRDAVDIENVFVPRIHEAVQRARAELLIVTGMGSCHPIIRTHRLVELLNPGVPVVVMFPGQQTMLPNGKRTLDVLATPAGTGGGKYRARNIFDF